MRLAFIVGSDYEASGKLPVLPSAALDGELVARRLAEPEAGFHVVRVAAARGLAETLEQHLHAETQLVDELLVYFSGYTVLSQERGPALLLDGERLGTFSLRRLRGLFARFSQRSCLIVDAAALVDSGQSLDAVVQAIGQALTEGVPSISALVAVRDSTVPDSFGGSAFTGLVLTALDWLAVSREPGETVDIERLYDTLRADAPLFHEIPATGLFGGIEPRLAILRAAPAQTTAAPQAATRHSSPFRRTQATSGLPLPSFADSPDLAADLASLLSPVGAPPPAFSARSDRPSQTGWDAELPTLAPAAEAVSALVVPTAGAASALVVPAADPLNPQGAPAAATPQELPASVPAPSALQTAEAAESAPAELPISGAATAPTSTELGASQTAAPGQRLDATEPAPDALAQYAQALLQVSDEDQLSRLAAELLESIRAGRVNPARAALVLEACLNHYPRSLPLRDYLMEACIQAGAPARALLHCQAAAQIAPLRAATYRRAQALFETIGAADGAWQSACVLESLGDADINESLLAQQHRPEGLLTPRETVSEEDFRRSLCPADPTLLMLPVLSALAGAVAALGIGYLKHKRVYQEPDASLLHDAERSTTMLAKTLAWSARLLGQSIPDLYVVPELPELIKPGAFQAPSVLCARALGSGFTLNQLAFLWGRELPRQRPEFRMFTFFPEPSELSSLVQAALTLAGVPGFDVRALSGDAKRLYTALRRELSGEALQALREAGYDFSPQDLETRAHWALVEFELLSVRSGLVASGDVATAAELMQRYPMPGRTLQDDQLAELYSFAISDTYRNLRQKLGVSVAGGA